MTTQLLVGLVLYLLTVIASVGGSLLYFRGEKRAADQRIEAVRAEFIEARRADRELFKTELTQMTDTLRRVERWIVDVARAQGLRARASDIQSET